MSDALDEPQVPVFLMVDDNPDEIVLATEAFATSGLPHDLRFVPDGVEALRYLRGEGEYGLTPRPDMILLDLNMPRMNGLDLVRALKDDPELCMIPVVMLTVSNREEDVLRAYGSGVATYVRKPVRFDDYLRVIRQFQQYWREVARLPRRS